MAQIAVEKTNREFIVHEEAGDGPTIIARILTDLEAGKSFIKIGNAVYASTVIQSVRLES